MRRLLLASVLVLSLVLFAGCEFFFGPSGISPDDPYDADCNLKEEYHKDWQKYSDFDYRIDPASRSYEAQQYYKAVERIAQVSGEIYTLERDMAIEEDMKRALIEYKTSLVRGHKQNLIKAYLRLSFYTADITWQNAVAGKGYAELLTGPALSGLQLAGESLKLINSYTPATSSLAIDTSMVEGKVNDVARTGWMETIASIEKSPQKIPQEMATKSIRYVMGVPDPSLSDKDIGILRQEHLELKRIDNLVQDADKRNFERLWQVRALEAEKNALEGTLFDLEYDEKDRVDAMLIGECKRKVGDEK